jgi:CDP-6-deoxy-D-xylo-4-hexulose-3-dehydrase
VKYPLASNSWDEKELEAIYSVIKSDMYTMGEKVKQFEKEFAVEMSCKHAVMVNSGSSANLIMLTAAKIKYDWGDDFNIIVPSVAWSTTYFPVHQIGARLNFIDVKSTTMNIDPVEVSKSINKDTKAILAVNLLGNPADYNTLKLLAEKHNLILLEDNCESFGATVDGKFTGTFGDMGSYSFFFSHHLQTMEGGMIVTDDDELMQIMRAARAHGWIRDMPNENKWYKKSSDLFKEPYIFAIPGYSLRPLEISGAIGSVQLKKWKNNVGTRRNNAEVVKKLFKNESCTLQEELPGHESSWYGFSFLVQNGKRDEVVSELMSKGIQLRPIMTGNMIRQPVMKYLGNPLLSEHYPESDIVDYDGFFLGNHPYDAEEDLTKIHKLMVPLL